VVCNADINVLFEAISLIDAKAARAVDALARQAARHRALPTLGFTHYQPAQPVTVGRRFALWAQDLALARERLALTKTSALAMRGLRGATGTQASFAALLGAKLESGPNRFEDLALARFRVEPLLDRTYDLTGQTYPRVIDTFILADLASCASVLHKIATDIRLLSNRKEIDEPFEDKQIGSSAMPYKRNPMRCERICGLVRFVMNLVGNAYDTAATQWLERTLDDSSNRRLSLPEAFLALDGALDLMHNVASGLIVHEATVKKNLMAELPFMATENILMACVQLGGDRQHYHELIRVHAQAAGLRVKQDGLDNDLLDRLKSDRAFWGKARGGPLAAELDWAGVMDPMKYVGRSVEQTDRFIAEVVEPMREQYDDAIARLGDTSPRV
ncbi:MAG: lyase family protein, partial [Phycisphaerales bacterium]